MTIKDLNKRLESLEQAGSQENKIFQFPEFRKLMQLSGSGLDSMYLYFDIHARQGIYPDIAERRALIPEIFKNRGDLC